MVSENTKQAKLRIGIVPRFDDASDLGSGVRRMPWYCLFEFEVRTIRGSSLFVFGTRDLLGLLVPCLLECEITRLRKR